MKNMVRGLSGAFLLLALLFLSSCVRMPETITTDFRLERSSQTLYGNASQLRFNTKKAVDSAALSRMVSERYEKDMMRWADYSSLETTP